MPLTIGTAGHIDHGKTRLVQALTGKDTDRLPEERRRGISIALGYAPLLLPDGRRLSLVDVPGHERFVRTMVAGATGIDRFLLVIDAAEGARPQTHEHLAILQLLGIDRGVVAVTKADLVDEETLELALEEARDLVPGAEAVAVSAKTGAGLEELVAAIARVTAEEEFVAQSYKLLSTRLYVDRVFSLPGIGTVATGTLWSGTIAVGDVLRVEPRGLEARVRSVEVHDEEVARAEAGQRVAVALTGVERSAIRRGDALVTAGAFPTSYRLDVALQELQPVAEGARVLVHHGTTAVPARVARIGSGYAQLRLDRPLVTARGDRVVLRGDTTLGGGLVVDPAPPRTRDEARVEAAARGDARAVVHEPVRERELVLRGLDPSGLVRADGWAFSQAWLDELGDGLRRRLAAADPLDPGVPPPPEPWSAAVVPLLGLERRGAKLVRPGATPELGARAAEADRLEAALAGSGFEPVPVADARLAAFLEERGSAVRVGDGLALSRTAYDEARRLLVAECAAAGSITLARFRDLLGTSRRPTQLLLERFDADGITRRTGDARVLRRAARA